MLGCLETSLDELGPIDILLCTFLLEPERSVVHGGVGLTGRFTVQVQSGRLLLMHDCQEGGRETSKSH